MSKQLTDMAVVEGGYKSFLLPHADAIKLAAILMKAERVEYDWTLKGWKTSPDDVAVTIKSLDVVQLAAIRLSDSAT